MPANGAHGPPLTKGAAVPIDTMVQCPSARRPWCHSHHGQPGHRRRVQRQFCLSMAKFNEWHHLVGYFRDGFTGLYARCPDQYHLVPAAGGLQCRYGVFQCGSDGRRHPGYGL